MTNARSITASWMHRFALVALLSGWLGSPIARADAVGELLRLVPDDPAFCLTVRDLRGHAQAVSQSRFFQRIRKTFVAGLLLQSPEARQLKNFNTQFRKHLGVGLEQIRDEILGDGLVFAYWPQSGDDPERGLFLTRARDAELLIRLVDEVNQVQIDNGEFEELEHRERHGIAYVVARHTDGGSTYQLVRDGLLVLSPVEAPLTHVIDVLAGQAEPGQLQTRFETLGTADRFAVFWINPRAFDAEMKSQLAAASETDAAFLRQFSRYWHAADGLAISLDVDADFHVHLTAGVKRDQLPSSARQLWQEASKPCRLDRCIPPDALASFAGRVHLPSLIATIRSFMTPDQSETVETELNRVTRALFGWSLTQDLAAHLGPDLALYARPPAANRSSPFPEVVLAIGIEAGPRRQEVADQLIGSARTLLGLIALARTQEGHLTELNVQKRDGVTVVFLSSETGLPAGIQPAVAVKDGCLVLASHPEAIRRFRLRSTGDSVAGGTRPLMELDFGRVADFLRDPPRRRHLTTLLMKADGISRFEATVRYQSLLALLALIDRIEVRTETTPHRIDISFHVRPVPPLSGE